MSYTIHTYKSARHLGCTSGCQDGRPSTSGPAGSWLSCYHCVPTRTKILCLFLLSFSSQFLCFILSFYSELYLFSSWQTLALSLTNVHDVLGNALWCGQTAQFMIRNSSKLAIFYSYKVCKQCKWTYSSNLHSSFNIRVNSLA